jgi:hypothetical protein
MPVQLLFSLRVLRKKIGMLVMIEGLVSSRSLYVVSKKESRLLTWGPDALGLDPGQNTSQERSLTFGL